MISLKGHQKIISQHSPDLLQQVYLYEWWQNQSLSFGISFFFRDSSHSTAKPQVSSTACVNLSNIFSFVSYGGRSRRLKQVWALGKFSVGASIKCRVKRRGPAAPVDPCKALNPWSGTWNRNNVSLSKINSKSGIFDARSWALQIWDFL